MGASYEKGVIFFNKKRWYFRLNPKDGIKGLHSDHPVSSLEKSLVICSTYSHPPWIKYPPKNNTSFECRLYTVFDSYIDFVTYMLNTNNWSFYEVILGQHSQKPHFDIDIDIEEFKDNYPGFDHILSFRNIYDSTITAIKEVINDDTSFSLERDLLIFSSNGKNKLSYHIIVNNWMHFNNMEAREFYDQVLVKTKELTDHKFDDHIHKYVDRNVYGTKQQFRTIGSRKLGSDRVKIFHNEFMYNGHKYTHTDDSEEHNNDVLKLYKIVSDSLISFTSGCKWVPIEVTERKYSSNRLKDEQLDKYIDYSIKLSDEKFGDIFTFDTIQNGEIRFKRKCASYCQLCQRIHDKQNPYIVVSNDNMYWHCRQFEGKGMYIGSTNIFTQSLEGYESTIEEEENIGRLIIDTHDIDIPHFEDNNINESKNRLINIFSDIMNESRKTDGSVPEICDIPLGELVKQYSKTKAKNIMDVPKTIGIGKKYVPRSELRIAKPKFLYENTLKHDEIKYVSPEEKLRMPPKILQNSTTKQSFIKSNRKK